MQDSLAGRTPHIDRIGISYMYFGAWQSKDGFSGHEFHVGPHLMIVSPRQEDFQGFNRDPSNGMPYVAHLPHRTELYLADEVFFCGTASEITPIRSIDKININNGVTGPVTLALQREFFGIINGAGPDRHNWFTPVPVKDRSKQPVGV